MRARHLMVLAITSVAFLAFGSPAQAAGPDHVFGQGTYRAEGPASFTDTALDLQGTDATPGVGTDGRGRFSISDRPSNGDGSDLQGDVFCVNATGNRGVVVGTVTEATPSGVVGRTAFIRITDNSKGGRNAPPDTAAFALSTLTPEQALAAGFCDTNFADNFPVTSGKFTVQDKS